MYRLLLSWRYLRTRWIALASVISVTLGVATMIIVNSVMDGFTHEMHNRLHDILSDVVVESHSLSGITDPDWHQMEIRDALGDDLMGMTIAVRVPAMINFQVRGQWVTQQILLIGVDDATYSHVSDCCKYLLHPENRNKLNFLLHDDGYDAPLTSAGWKHRRLRVGYERAMREQMEHLERMRAARYRSQSESKIVRTSLEEPVASDVDQELEASPLPHAPASLRRAVGESSGEPDSTMSTASEVNDPFSKPGGTPLEAEGTVFDEMNEQHTGIILGISITCVRHRDVDGKVEQVFLARPGDDVQITFPTSGQPPKAVTDKFTIVDLYQSKMSEYDSTFAFVPLRKLQHLRGMIDPLTGQGNVTSIQLKLRPGADLAAARDKLRARFPMDQYAYRIDTWRDLQGPLLAAVQMETTILNILLFLIIAVAGFGILATFFMIVVEKTRDIGVLKALGAPSAGVLSIFLTYGLSLGAVGSGAGMIIGLLFVRYINDIAKVLELVTGREVFDPTIYYFEKIPTIVSPPTVIWVVIGAVVIAVLASVLPSLRAARLHPVEALRYE